MNTADNGRDLARSLAMTRLRNLTIGTALLGVGATAGLGWLAANTDSGSSGGAATAAVTTAAADTSTTTGAATTTTPTPSLTSAPVVTAAGGPGQATTGGS